MNKKLLLVIFFISIFYREANASSIGIIRPSFFEKIINAISICRLNIPCYFSDKLGSSITTIQGTDTLSNSRTTINTNFSNLNADKMENATTSVKSITTLSNLTSIGTIGTGVWQGSIIGVAYGGTASSTLSLNQLLLGNGSSGFKTVAGWGNSGEALVSNGILLSPTWQSVAVNQTQNYLWTGNHNFTGTTLIKNLNASSTVANPMVLNGVSYNMPIGGGASSTVPVNNGSNGIVWDNQDWNLLGEATWASGGTTTLASIPARRHLRIRVYSGGTDGLTSVYLSFNGIYTSIYSSDSSTASGVLGGGGAAAMTGRRISLGGNATTTPSSYTINVFNESGTGKFVDWTGILLGSITNGGGAQAVHGGGFWNSTNQITKVEINTDDPTKNFLTGTKIIVEGSRN